MKSMPYIGVIGAGTCPAPTYELARTLGFEIGIRGWVLVCGGLGGVMEGAARGCLEGGGMTVGILPGLDRGSANPYITITLPTGLGDERNLLIVRSADLLVAVSGGYGTLSEIALALKADKPIIGLQTWEDIPGVHYVKDPAEAVSFISSFFP